jgi:hypothetical protein
MGGRNDFKYDAKSGQWKQAFEVDEEELEDFDEEIEFLLPPASIQRNTSINLSHSKDAHDNHRKDGKKHKNKKNAPKRQHSPPAVERVKTGAEILEEHAQLIALYSAQSVDLEAGGQHSKLNSKLARPASSSALLHNHHGGGAGGAGGDAAGVLTAAEERASWGLFVLVGGMHVVSALTQGALFALLPVYLMGVVSTYGLGYGIHDLALVLSATAMCVLHWHVFFSLRLEYCLKASPVRTLRIACGFLIALCFILPMYLDVSTYNSNSAAAMLVATTTPIPVVLNGNIRGGMVYDTVTAPRDTHIKMPRDSHHNHHFHTAGVNSVNYNPPSRSVITFILTSFLMSVLVVAAHMSRKATNILFHLTLNSTFTSSTSLRCISNHLLDIAAPLIACYWLRVRHNSAFFLSLIAFVMLPVYIASIFLGVQFRGDYGVMTDSNGGGTGQAVHNHNAHFASSQGQDVFSLPLGDLSLLFSQIGYSYGSKLYNLRDDFKDL